MLYDIYRYENGYDVLFDNGRFTCANNLTDNRNMDSRLIKIHRGVDNVLRFRAFNSDRKRDRLDHLRIKATLINRENRERVLSVYADHDSCEPGIFRFSISEGQLIDVAAGFYDFVICGEEFAIPEQPGEIMSVPFYTDLDANVRMMAEVTDSVEKAPIPTVEMTEWSATSHVIDGIMTKVHFGTPIPANRLKNLMNGTHTFTISAEAFMGKVLVCGSLNHIPPSPSNLEEYFPLNINDFTNVITLGTVGSDGRLQIFSGIEAWSLQANVMWLMFYWYATDNKGVPHPTVTDPTLVLPDLTEVPNRIDRIQVRS